MASFLKEAILFVSVGKYSTVMYYRGRTFQASMVGGILTVIGVLALLAYSVVILV